jgi:hypothetical protein
VLGTILRESRRRRSIGADRAPAEAVREEQPAEASAA